MYQVAFCLGLTKLVYNYLLKFDVVLLPQQTMKNGDKNVSNQLFFEYLVLKFKK